MAKLNKCCENEANRVTRPEDQNPEKPEITVERCGVCNRRHITANLEPGHFGIKGSQIGRHTLDGGAEHPPG